MYHNNIVAAYAIYCFTHLFNRRLCPIKDSIVKYSSIELSSENFNTNEANENYYIIKRRYYMGYCPKIEGVSADIKKLNKDLDVHHLKTGSKDYYKIIILFIKVYKDIFEIVKYYLWMHMNMTFIDWDKLP